MRNREVKEYTQNFTARKWHNCDLNTDQRSDSRTLSLMLCGLSKGEEGRCFCFSSFLSVYRASTRDLMFLNSWVSHSGASKGDSYPLNNMYTLYTKMLHLRLIVNLRKTECKEEPIWRKLYLQILTGYTKAVNRLTSAAVVALLDIKCFCLFV